MASDVWKLGAVVADEPRRGGTHVRSKSGLFAANVKGKLEGSNHAWGVWNENDELLLVRRGQWLTQAFWRADHLYVVAGRTVLEPGDSFPTRLVLVERFDGLPVRAAGEPEPSGGAPSVFLDLQCDIPVEEVQQLDDDLLWIHFNSGAGEYAYALIRDGAELTLVQPGLVGGGTAGFYAEPLLVCEEGGRFLAIAYSEGVMYERNDESEPVTATFGVVVMHDVDRETVVERTIDLKFPDSCSEEDADDWLLENGGPTDLSRCDDELVMKIGKRTAYLDWPIERGTTRVTLRDEDLGSG